MAAVATERVTLASRVAELVRDHKSYQGASDATGVDRCYLHHMAAGRRRNPSKATLDKLGLKRVIEYERKE